MKIYTLKDESPYKSNRFLILFKKFLLMIHVDLPLLLGLIALCSFGLFVLFSASNKNLILVYKQFVWVILSFGVMVVLALIPPSKYKSLAPWLFFITCGLLLIVLLAGFISKGAQRWLSLGFFSFQPAEIMKIVMPLMLSWYLSEKQFPPKLKEIFIAICFLIIPVLLIAKQPDLGTAIIVMMAGLFVLLLSGMAWKIICYGFVLIVSFLPVLWHFLHTYQKDRVLTFLNPERDPLGAGYHIIQSKIAIGSGGLFGKGWLHGTQSQLHFLPEHATDFIFSVCGEELGFFVCFFVLSIFLYITARGLYISYVADDSFTRLLSGSLILTFFISFFVNIGMVIGILPVVGLPLPMFSYGGTSMVTLMAGFGIIMSIHSHKKLITT